MTGPDTAQERAGPPPDAPEQTRRGRLVAAAVTLLLGWMAAAMLTTAVQQTPTVDEPVYAGTATVYVQQHDLRYNVEHPPLGKLLIGLGLAVEDPRLSAAAPDAPSQSTLSQSALGTRLLYESGNDPWRVMFAARLPVILLTLLFGLVVFGFARDLAGPAGGLIALALYTLTPDIVANGSLATLDVPAVGFLLTACWMLWRARHRPRRYLPLAGLALGAALATKMSTLPAVPVVLLLAALAVWRAGWTRRLLAAAGVGALGVAVVWASYLAVDPRLRWRPTRVPHVGGLHGLLVEAMPFPAPYRDGMRIQFAFEHTVWQGYLFGHLYLGGRWYYLPAALLVKSPLGALVLWLAGAAVLLAVRRLRPGAPYVLLPAAVLLAASLDEARNLGVRYAIFIPMFLAVAAGGLAVVHRRALHVATVVLVLFVAVSSVRTFPYYLPYSNEAFGGPANTYRNLHDSNVDWGQDLGRLAERLHTRYPNERVWLVYKGSGVPSAYGIEAADPLTARPADVTGLLVVSDSALIKADGLLKQLVDGSRRIDDVGHSITIFRRPG